MKDYKAILISMINDDLLDWELVGREMLERMPMSDVKNMILKISGKTKTAKRQSS